MGVLLFNYTVPRIKTGLGNRRMLFAMLANLENEKVTRRWSGTYKQASGFC